MPRRASNRSKRRQSEELAQNRKCVQCNMVEKRVKECGEEITLFLCPMCKNISTLYCSAECQLAHFSAHKYQCRHNQHKASLRNMAVVSFEQVFEDEYLLAKLEESFPSESSVAAMGADKLLLKEAREVVQILSEYVPGRRDAFCAGILVERLLRNDRAPLRALCQARTKEEARISVVCQHTMNVMLQGDLTKLGSQCSGVHVPFSGESKGANYNLEVLSSYRAIVDLLRVFPEDVSEEKVIHPILISDTEARALYCSHLYSNKRVTLYLQSNFSHHVLLCKALCQRMFCPALGTSQDWACGCLTLLHFLVASFSYPEPAEVILLEASKAMVYHEDKQTKAGFREYFLPLLALFELCCQTVANDNVMHLLSQLAALLVAQSRRVQNLGQHHFDVHTQYLEHLFTTQFTGHQLKHWTCEYLPWADKVVKDRSD